MSRICVRIHGKGVKYFKTQREATAWALFYTMTEPATQKMFEYIDEAVEKSDLKEAKEVINHVMELK